MKTLIKMKLQLLFMLLTAFSYAQVGIGTETPEPDAILELKSDDKALLLTRLDDESTVTNPVDGMVYMTKILTVLEEEPMVFGWILKVVHHHHLQQ